MWWCLALTGLCFGATADRLEATERTAPRPLAGVLEDLRAAGVPIVYSSRLVRPDMSVPENAGVALSREGLRSLLAGYDLGLEDGPNGVLMVVRMPAPRSTRARAPRHAAVPAATGGAHGGTTGAAAAAPTWTLRETIEVVQAEAAATPRPGVTFDRREIDALPDQRNPWALMSRVAGITSDSIDVGGSETGRQTSLAAPAAPVTGNTYFVDGIETTDMASTGHSTIFFDLEHFASVQLATGGVDVTTPTAGVAVHLTTKRGGDQLRASVHASQTQGSSADRAGVAGSGALIGNRIERVVDAGIDGGGPVVRDRLYAWGGLSSDVVEATATGGDRDDTSLGHGALKLNVQPSQRASMVVSAISSDKRKPTRGADPSRAIETTWRQKTPSTAVKLEHSQLLGSRAVVTGHASQVDGEFSLRARGGSGPDGGEAFLGPDGVWRDGYLSGFSDRDAGRYEVSSDVFFESEKVDHKLRFGASYRRFDTASSFVWPGPRQAMRVACEQVGTCAKPNLPPTAIGELIAFFRDATGVSELDYQALWLQDTMTLRRTTFDLGVRFDRQAGAIAAGSVDANPIVPEVLPAIATSGVDGGFDWSSLSPRLGLARTFGSDHRSVLRLGFSRFSSQLGVSQVSRLDPLQGATASFLYQDLDGDRDWQPNEPLQLLAIFGQSLLDPASGASPNRTDPDLAPELTDEITASFERDIGSRMQVTSRLAWRRVHDIHDERLLVVDGGEVRVARRADYVPDGSLEVARPDGTLVRSDFYALRPGLARSGGTWLTNGERERRYLGLGLSFIRRQDRRYMLRAHLDWGNAEWYVPDAFAVFADANDRVGSDSNDGDLFAERSPTIGSGNSFLQAGWSAQMSGNLRIAPQRPWGFDLAASAFARQGQPLPYFVTRLTSDGIRREIQVTERLDEFRADDLVMVDLRLSKDVRLGSQLGGTFSVEVFNALDRRTVLDRSLQVASALAGTPSRTVSPRVLRLGLRLSWR